MRSRIVARPNWIRLMSAMSMELILLATLGFALGLTLSLIFPGGL